mmetsp:Transcript_2470/g.5091  ORF Transcript_2470/g.5091 Transcript_2470/m.5091 type:complete len:232 (-) Transcript_2470:673-1368(-)
MSLSSTTARCQRLRYGSSNCWKSGRATVALGKRNPCVTVVVVGPSGMTFIHHAQSLVTFSCSVGKREMKYVLARRPSISGKGAASPGSGTIDRSLGTCTASQLPIGSTPVYLPMGSECIGPNESRCTKSVWYVSEVFCMMNFQLHSTLYDLWPTVTRSSNGQSASASSGALPRDSSRGGASSLSVKKRKPRKLVRRISRSGHSALSKHAGMSCAFGTPASAPLVGLYVQAW